MRWEPMGDQEPARQMTGSKSCQKGCEQPKANEPQLDRCCRNMGWDSYLLGWDSDSVQLSESTTAESWFVTLDTLHRQQKEAGTLRE